jgi:hypothetical protein
LEIAKICGWTFVHALVLVDEVVVIEGSLGNLTLIWPLERLTDLQASALPEMPDIYS